jgi:protein gp37
LNKTAIQWTNYTTQVVRFRDERSGDVLNHCRKVSPGCANCYAERLTKRFKGRHRSFTPAGGVGLVPFVDERALRELAGSGRRRRGMVFVEDMSDLFGDWVTWDMLDQCFGAFALSGLTVQVLTKRAELMHAYLTAPGVRERIARAARVLAGLDPAKLDELEALKMVDATWFPWPLPNVWLGVSVETQECADERLPFLMKTPAAVRFASYEPALEWVNFSRYIPSPDGFCIDWSLDPADVIHVLDGGRGLDWVIIGGESGHGARWCDVSWIRAAVRQLREVNVAVFVKQLGSRPFELGDLGDGNRVPIKLKDGHGGDPSEWPEELRDARAWPATAARDDTPSPTSDRKASRPERAASTAAAPKTGPAASRPGRDRSVSPGPRPRKRGQNR